jgi:tetratricopeptide (TPR) repeat protein
LQDAKKYYREALSLSPQNSVIRNEYANLLVMLDNNCDAAVDTYQRSLEIDPFYVNTYLGLAGAYEVCATRQPAEAQAEYYRRAAQLLEESLAYRSDDAGTVMVQAGHFYQQAGDYDAAIAALEEARQLGGAQVPAWNIDFQLAQVYFEMGDVARAQELAEQALAAAPAEAQEQIQTFLGQVNSE